MSATKVNEELLRETLEWALREWHKQQAGLPSEWEQASWMTSMWDAFVEKGVDSGHTYAKAEELAQKLRLSQRCGTACCIAGKVALGAGWKPAYDDGPWVKKRGEGERYVSDVALEQLGLPDGSLFNGDNTIRDLYVIAGDLTNGRIEMPPTIALTELNTTAEDVAA